MVTGAQNAMTARGVAARHVGKRHGHDVLAQKAADPTDRTNKRSVLVAPALAAVVGPLQAGDRLLAQNRQDRGSRCGGNVLLGEHVLTAVGVLATDQVLGSHTALAGEALGGLGGVAVGIKGNVCRGTALDLMDLIVAVATLATSAARRRGLEITRTSPWARPASSRPLAIMVPSCLTALFSGAEGISSVPISNRKSLASAMAYATSPSWSAFSLTPATSAI